MLEVIENHDWFHDLNISNSSTRETETKEAVNEKFGHSPALPVLRSTVEQGDVSQSFAKIPETPEPQLLSTKDDQFALKLANGTIKRGRRPLFLPIPCRVNRLCSVPSVAGEDDTQDASEQATVILPIRPSRAKKFKLTSLEPASINLTINTDPKDIARPPVAVGRILTIEWVTRETKGQIGAAVVEVQACGLCNFCTNEHRMSIDVRQQYCMHYCH